MTIPTLDVTAVTYGRSPLGSICHVANGDRAACRRTIPLDASRYTAAQVSRSPCLHFCLSCEARHPRTRTREVTR